MAEQDSIYIANLARSAEEQGTIYPMEVLGEPYIIANVSPGAAGFMLALVNTGQAEGNRVVANTEEVQAYAPLADLSELGSQLMQPKTPLCINGTEITTMQELVYRSGSPRTPNPIDTPPAEGARQEVAELLEIGAFLLRRESHEAAVRALLDGGVVSSRADGRASVALSSPQARLLRSVLPPIYATDRHSLYERAVHAAAVLNEGGPSERATLSFDYADADQADRAMNDLEEALASTRGPGEVVAPARPDFTELRLLMDAVRRTAVPPTPLNAG